MSPDTPPPLRVPRWMVTLVFSAVLLALLLVWIPFAQVWSALLAVDWRWLVLAAGFTFLNLLLRGWRWALITGRSGPGQLATATWVCALAVGLNAVVPGKVGELARISMTVRHLNLPIGRSVAGALAERLIDLLILMLLVAVPLYLVAPGQTPFIIGLSRLAGHLAWGGALLAGGLLALGHAGVNRRIRGAVFAVLRGRFPRAARALHRSLYELRQALRHLASMHRLLQVLGLTSLMWLALGLGVWVAAHGSPAMELSLPVALAFAALTVLAAALPSAPGAWGVFEAAGVVALMALAGVADRAAALAFVIAVHLAQYLPVVLAAWASWLALGRGRFTGPAARR